TRNRCPGATYRWNIPRAFATYPFSVHEPDSGRVPGYTLLAVDAVASALHLRSTQCFGFAAAEGECCKPCRGLHSNVAGLAASARDSIERKPVAQMNRDQLGAKLREVTRQCEKERLKNLNLVKYTERARKRNEAHSSLLTFISTTTVPGLPRLLSTAHKDGWSATKLLEKAQLTAKGKHHPRDYTLLERDLSTLIYDL
ncbi:hypothetical protein R3P38DRAFT_2455862, partial [Favolaschia claudopus]